MIKPNDEYRKFFDSQDPDEKVILVVRKHPYLLSLPFLTIVMLWLISVAVYLFFSSQNFFGEEIVKVILVTIISLTLVYGVLLSFIGWLLKYLDILILTNKHLVVVRQNGLFNRGMSVLDLSTIQDVSIEQRGPLETFLKYGKLIVQTAGEVPQFVYTGPKNIEKIQDAIMDAKHQFIEGDRHPSGNGVSSNIISK